MRAITVIICGGAGWGGRKGDGGEGKREIERRGREREYL